MDNVPSYKDIFENSALAEKMPKYTEMLKEEYNEYLKKYDIIIQRGGNLDDFLDIRRKAASVACAAGIKHEDGLVKYKQKDLEINKFKDVIEIIYLDTVVLDNTHYYPGNWEERIKALYLNIPFLLQEKQREKNTKENIKELASKITTDEEFAISKNTKIVKFNHDEKEEEYINRGITVESDGEIVFADCISGFEHYGSTPERKHFYKAGLWEDEIADYLNKKQEDISIENEHTKRL